MQKIAIVDDAEDNREFLYYLLRDHYQVGLYGSGEEMLGRICLNPPDLIIMDIWLNNIDGSEVLRRIRQDQALRKVLVVALTANAMAGDREKYLAAGFDEYVSKPILDIGNLLTTVRRLLLQSEPK
jgi:two-component system, cell cycle response regulator DivK